FGTLRMFIARFFSVFHITIGGIHHICFVMEQYGCDVAQFMRSNTRGFTTTLCFMILKQVLQAFKYLHEVAQISHLDLKPENVVFVSWRRKKVLEGLDVPEMPFIRIIDFNSAVAGRQYFYKSACTINYRPPEACFKMLLSNLVDIWAIGCFAYYLHKKAMLFSNSTDM
ncbi:hypothetical protein PFISCL1PPCAC_26696, partial [Pristionchus fissidentatus]